jgi:hypothetical protein
LNLYPLKTQINGRILRNLRLVVEGEQVILWTWDHDSQEAVALRSLRGKPTRVGATQLWQVDDLLLEPQRGCGCQHPMHTFVPPKFAS